MALSGSSDVRGGTPFDITSLLWAAPRRDLWPVTVTGPLVVASFLTGLFPLRAHARLSGSHPNHPPPDQFRCRWA